MSEEWVAWVLACAAIVIYNLLCWVLGVGEKFLVVYSERATLGLFKLLLNESGSSFSCSILKYIEKARKRFPDQHIERGASGLKTPYAGRSVGYRVFQKWVMSYEAV